MNHQYRLEKYPSLIDNDLVDEQPNLPGCPHGSPPAEPDFI